MLLQDIHQIIFKVYIKQVGPGGEIVNLYSHDVVRQGNLQKSNLDIKHTIETLDISDDVWYFYCSDELVNYWETEIDNNTFIIRKVSDKFKYNSILTFAVNHYVALLEKKNEKGLYYYG